MSSKVIEAIAQGFQVFQVEANTEIYQQGNKPLGFYLLKWGSVEIYRSSLVGRTHINYRNAGEIFGCVPLLESEATAIYRASAVALSKSEIWFLERDRLSYYLEVGSASCCLSLFLVANYYCCWGSDLVIYSLIYERRLWCRYLCPIGGMNGMFAKLAAVELRSTQQVCGSQCSTFGCYKGGEATTVNFTNPLPTQLSITGL